MKFRPCIDIHNGAVKQIVGGSLSDKGDQAEVNFTSKQIADYYAEMYRRDGLKGGHVILLNPASSEHYKDTYEQALLALHAYPGGLQIGGGVTAQNAEQFLEEGASHVIVTSYVFQNGEIKWEHLRELERAVGKKQVVLDLSCRKRDGRYYIVTDRWQKFTDVVVEQPLLKELSAYCDEFLVHGVDVEGTGSGMETELVKILAEQESKPITYAGGIGSVNAVEAFREASGGRLDFTIGSALDIFGGTISYDAVKKL